MLSIIAMKLASSLTRLSGIARREWWCVTPQGRIASNSGCTEVLVDGASTPNLARQPSESGIGIECHTLHRGAAHDQPRRVRQQAQGADRPLERRDGQVAGAGAGRLQGVRRALR